MNPDQGPLPVFHDQPAEPPQLRAATDETVAASTLRNWRDLAEGRTDDVNPVRAALESMVGWVDWLVGRYRLDHVVPPCWWAHGPMVEELSALQAAWHGSYVDVRAPADAGVIWHGHLARCLTRLREWNIERCATGHHRPVGANGWNTDLSWPPDPSQPADQQLKAPTTSGEDEVQPAAARVAG